MATEFNTLDNELRQWINAQQMFFVATAPLDADGIVNCSPKGLDSFRVIDERTVAYLDLTGSGAETIAHLKENGRLCIMFCAFAGAPKILRLQGTGSVLLPESADYQSLIGLFPETPGARAIIRLDIRRIADSCGYGVPEYEFKKERPTLVKWAEKKGADGVRAYQQENNTKSLDGLPGIPDAKNENTDI